MSFIRHENPHKYVGATFTNQPDNSGSPFQYVSERGVWYNLTVTCTRSQMFSIPVLRASQGVHIPFDSIDFRCPQMLQLMLKSRAIPETLMPPQCPNHWNLSSFVKYRAYLQEMLGLLEMRYWLRNVFVHLTKINAGLLYVWMMNIFFIKGLKRFSFSILNSAEDMNTLTTFEALDLALSSHCHSRILMWEKYKLKLL